MAWTPPRTITVGEVITGQYLNTYVRDNPAYLKGVVSGTEADKIPNAALTASYGARAESTTIQSIASHPTSLASLTFNFYRTLYGQGWASLATPGALALPVAGFWAFGAQVAWYTNPTGFRHLVIVQTGGGAANTVIAQDKRLAVGDNARTEQDTSGFEYFPSGTILVVQVGQTSGGALSVDSRDSSPAIWAYLIRAEA